VKLSLLDDLEHAILFRMVDHVRVACHVVDDVEHQRVIRRIAVVKDHELIFEQVQEPSEIHVVGMPQGECHGHDAG